MDLRELLGTDPANRPEIVQILNGISNAFAQLETHKAIQLRVCVCAHVCVFGDFEVNTSADSSVTAKDPLHNKQSRDAGGDVHFTAIRIIIACGDIRR